jgi:small-conductance mechanosensitive channel
MSDWETANVEAVVGFIIVAVFMSIGVVLLYQVETATPTIANSSGWYSTQSTLATTASSGYGLLGITLIVMAAVAILGTLFVLIPRGD